MQVTKDKIVIWLKENWQYLSKWTKWSPKQEWPPLQTGIQSFRSEFPECQHLWKILLSHPYPTLGSLSAPGSTFTTLLQQRLRPGSACTGTDRDPDLHTHFPNLTSPDYSNPTHTNAHCGHTSLHRSFADSEKMQVTEDKHNDLLKWNSLTGPVPSCYLVDSFDGDYHEDVSEMIVK